jgi:hypothetical protein
MADPLGQYEETNSEIAEKSSAGVVNSSLCVIVAVLRVSVPLL